MKRAIVVTDVSRQVIKDGSVDPATWPRTEPSYVVGPRGGRYLALGPWERIIDEGSRWDMNLVSIVDRSAAVRYLRPGSREWQKAATA